ncbi:MAG: 16S rRNA (cytosine(1402)-N(4))-methyltransferase RsmH, partial [Verrucomicrobiales bacterium]
MPPFIHQPVLLKEVLEALAPGPGKLHLDGTLGGGGHAEAVLEASSPDGRLIGLDRDTQALEAASERLSRFGDRVEAHQSNFADLLDLVAEESCDSILLDLGVSSPQLDRAERGFAFKAEGPLDMRMDQSQGETAADIINTWEAEDLANLFFQYGDERHSRRIAREIEARRKLRK